MTTPTTTAPDPRAAPIIPLPHTDPVRWRALVTQHQRAWPADHARIARGFRVLAQRDLRAGPAPDTWYVPGSTPGTWYTVTGQQCTCPDSVQRAPRCKHVWAVDLLAAAITAEAARLQAALHAALDATRAADPAPAGGEPVTRALARLQQFYAQYGALRTRPPVAPPAVGRATQFTEILRRGSPALQSRVTRR